MIAAFYSNKSVLITGATGFLGKVLMEKLFRTSPHLKVIYILVRPKSGQTLQERVFQILNSKVCPVGTLYDSYDGQGMTLLMFPYSSVMLVLTIILTGTRITRRQASRHICERLFRSV